ncbi:hypothetical protein D9M69_644360 [compost metagenome]
MNAIDYGVPGRSIFPVEGWIGIARTPANGQAGSLEPLCDAPSGFAGGAEDQRDGLGRFHRVHLHRLM